MASIFLSLMDDVFHKLFAREIVHILSCPSGVSAIEILPRGVLSTLTPPSPSLFVLCLEHVVCLRRGKCRVRGLQVRVLKKTGLAQHALST